MRSDMHVDTIEIAPKDFRCEQPLRIRKFSWEEYHD